MDGMQKPADTKMGVTAIIFDNNTALYFLIMHRVQGWAGWEFVKGGLNDGETGEQALVREIFEETGLKKFKVHKKLDSPLTFTADGVTHIHAVYLVEASMNVPVVIPKSQLREHDNYLWAQHERVAGLLTHESFKHIFPLACDEIKKLAR